MEVTNKFIVVNAKCLGRFHKESTGQQVDLDYTVEDLTSLIAGAVRARHLLIQQLSAQPSQKETSRQPGVV